MAEYIWNGVGLTAPDTWEPSAIERDGFLLARENAPMCELKWRTVHGSFAFDKHIRKLARSSKEANISQVPDSETPAAWRAALATLDASGIKSQSFIWQTGSHRGIGAALHNTGTGLAALIQFFITEEYGETVAAHTLATFRDYSAGKTVPWTMFGIGGRVPSSFSLNTFSFKPGHYTIEYWRPKSAKRGGKLPAGKGPGTALTFERFAPASVLLKGSDLETWVESTIEDTSGKAISLTSDSESVVWEGATKTSTLRRLLRRELLSVGKAWTTDAGNAILVVSATGVVPLAENQFNDITKSYALV